MKRTGAQIVKLEGAENYAVFGEVVGVQVISRPHEDIVQYYHPATKKTKA